MASDTALLDRTPVGLTPTRTIGRPGPLRLIRVLIRHGLTAFRRAPAATFFTLIFPLSFLVIIGSTVGHQTYWHGTRVSQLLIAPFGVFGVAEAAFCILAVTTARMREDGVLKRWRGTPAPPWTILAGQIGSAVVMSVLSVALLVAVGAGGYGVRIVWHKAPAAVLTLLVGIVCCAAIGLALVALTRSVLAVQALTNGVLVPLAFISHVFIIGSRLPTGLDWVSRALPLRHFADALAGTFDPSVAGTGFAWVDLAVLAGWSALAMLVALKRFGWEPRSDGLRRRRATSPSEAAVAVAAAPQATDLATIKVGRRSWRALLDGQIGYALTGMRRTALPVVFAVALPALLLLLFPVVFTQRTVHGLRLADFMLASMVTFGAAFASYVSMTEAIASSRAQGVLKRLRGTPLPLWMYLAARVAGAMLLTLAAMVALLTIAVTVDGYRIRAAQLPAAFLAALLSSACFASLGLAVLTWLRSARTLNPVTLGTLMPIAFISDVFYLGPTMSRPLRILGDVFPVKHSVYALLTPLRPDAVGAGLAWGHLSVLLAWTIGALLIARRFSWRPAQG